LPNFVRHRRIAQKIEVSGAMEEKISLTIDGARASGRPGTTILGAARKVGIDIPPFCRDGVITPSILRTLR